MIKNKVTIVFLIDFLSTSEGMIGGTEKQLLEVVSRLDPSRFETKLFCLQDYKQYQLLLPTNIKAQILDVYSLFSVKSFCSLFSFVNYLRKHSVDIVQTFFHDSTLFGIVAARLAGINIKISSRRDLGFWYTEKLLRNMLFINKLTDRILTNSITVKNFVIQSENYSPNKIDVIHNGIDFQYINNVSQFSLHLEFSGIEHNNLIIGMVANYNRQVKRADLFITAAAEINKRHPDVKFLLIGGGKLEDQLRAQIYSLGLNDKVIIAGKKDPAISYIKSFDIGVLTSDSEGFSNVLLEYMAAGIPSVATNVGGNSEIIQNDNLGLLVPKNDPHALAQAICGLLENEARRKEMGKAARAHVEEHYAWPKKIKEIEAYYEGLVESRKR
jgi:L-malate glycosyltransferase